MPKHMTDTPERGMWYICEKMIITRTDGKGLNEPQLGQHELRLDGPFSTEEEAKKKLPDWQQQRDCHEPFVWLYP
jgi:hypothetical protein